MLTRPKRAKPTGCAPAKRDAMLLRLNAFYVDGQAIVWHVISVGGPVSAPVTAARWVDRRYVTRTYREDGRYWGAERPGPWDLDKELAG